MRGKGRRYCHCLLSWKLPPTTRATLCWGSWWWLWLTTDSHPVPAWVTTGSSFQGGLGVFVQLMPILILILVSALSQLMVSSPPYSLSPRPWVPVAGGEAGMLGRLGLLSQQPSGTFLSILQVFDHNAESWLRIKKIYFPCWAEVLDFYFYFAFFILIFFG